jgi:hypothetical protein
VVGLQPLQQHFRLPSHSALAAHLMMQAAHR